METIIDKLRTLQAAAEILGISLKDLLDAHGRGSGASVGPADGDPLPRAVSTQQDRQAKTQSEAVHSTSHVPTIQYSTLSTPLAQKSASLATYGGSGALLANNWFTGPSTSLVSSGGARISADIAKPDLLSAPLEYPACHAAGRSTSSISSSHPTSHITYPPAIEKAAAADLWLGPSSVSVYDNDICFGTSPNYQDDQTGATNGSGDTWSVRALDTQFPDQHLPPHEPLLGLSPIPLLDPCLEAQESWAPIQTGDAELGPFLMPSFAPAPCLDPDTPGSSQLGPAPTLGSSSPLKKRPERGAGRLSPLIPLPAPPELGGPTQTPRKRRRRRYDEHERSETHITRTIGGCIACRSRRKRCRRISDDPSVPCEYCLSGFASLPCIRGKITDCSLYRKTNNSPFEADHPLTGPDFGNFSRSKIWAAGESRVFECGQGLDRTLRLRVRPFLPPKLSPAEQIDNKGRGAKGRHLYAIPWAIADLDETIAEVHRYLDSGVSSYIQKSVRSSDSLISPLFWHARRLAQGPNPNILIMQTLRFWTAARFIEGGWRCTGEDKLGAERVSPPWRSQDNISLPPYIDYELSSIFMERILRPLELAVLGGLARMIGANKPGDWFTVLVVIVILMHSFELIIQHETAYTHKRGIQEKFDDMKLVQQYLWGVKTLLAHFHGVTRGALPFESSLGRTIVPNKRIPNTDGSRLQMIQSIIQNVQQNRNIVEVSNNQANCDARFWCVGQIFDTRWEPRKDPEESPLHGQETGPET